MLTIENFVDEDGNYPKMIECLECGSVEIGEKHISILKIFIF